MIDYLRSHPFTVAIVLVILWIITELVVQIRRDTLARRGEIGMVRDKPTPKAHQYEGMNVPPQPGDRRWSPHFGSYIEMVCYSSDRQYWFTVLSGLHAGKTYRNQSPWSTLPHSKPRLAK